MSKEKTKIVFIDIDNTLTSKKSMYRVSQENIKYLNLIQNKGIYTVLTTGRAEEDTKNVWNQIKINNYCDWIISSNGAMISNGETNKILFNKIIPSEIAKNIVEYCKRKGFYIKLSNYKYLRRTKKKTLWEKIINNFFALPIEDIMPIEEIDYENVNKIGIFASMSKNKTRKIAQKLEIKFPELEIVVSLKNIYIEITLANINKGNAAKALIEHLKINQKETAAIGDSMNDYKIFEVVNKKIAVKNADPKLKKIANFTVSSSKNNGVAEAIKFVIL